jgi:hypothetical protein
LNTPSHHSLGEADGVCLCEVEGAVLLACEAVEAAVKV